MRPEIISLRAVAELLGLSVVQIQRLRRERGLPAFKIGRSVRFRRSEVEAWLETQREKPAKLEIDAD